MQFTKTVRNLVLLTTLTGAVVSCNPFKKKPQTSTATGWNYNDKSMGNFNVPKPKDIKAAPGLVFVQGGTFTMGAAQEDVMGDWNNIQRRITVNSFFIDKTEVTNLHYREYLYWITNVFGGAGMDSIVNEALPDTLVWRSELAYNEPMVEYYFRHPSYNNFPVVGVSWKQATDYCIWRTDRVNELTLMKSSYLDPKNQIKKELNGAGQDNFNTRAYLLGEYQATPGRDATKKSNPLKDAQGRPRTKVSFEDGILFGDYRLPTEAEWEYAARGGLKNQTFPWGNEPLEKGATKANTWQGKFPNTNTGADGYMRIAPVAKYAPNAYGLYDMSGNVWEWCSDWYDANYYASVAQKKLVNPTGSNKSFDPDEPTIPKKVVRGGSFLCHDSYCASYRVSARMKTATDTGLEHTGFRCVTDASSKK